MSVITNKHSLPEEVYRALCSNRYSGDDDGRKTDYSATTLVSPTQQVVLRRRYPEANSEDAVDRVWSMFGSIAHSLLEEHGADDALTENRFYAEVLSKTISGQVDHYKDGVITDYKTTSAFKVSKRTYDDWEKQLNVYAFLARENGLMVRNLRVIAIIRDWSERETIKPDYPQTPIVEIPITLWEQDDAEQFVLDRVLRLSVDEEYDDFNQTPCTDEEMWATSSKWAVIKDGSTRASRIFETEEEALAFVDGANKTDLSVVERKGERRRCSKYCNVSAVCVQYQDYLRSIAND